jgi:hypothetical protein
LENDNVEGPILGFLVLASLVAVPILFIWAKRAFDRAVERSLEEIYADAERQTQAFGPSAPRVTFTYHTYSGILFYVNEVEHEFHLPPPVAEATLTSLFRHTARYGFFAYGALLIPVLAYYHYRRELRSIQSQADSTATPVISRPRKKPARRGSIERWGGAFLWGFVGVTALVLGVKELYEAATNRSPRLMTCAQVTTEVPSGTWVRLTDYSGSIHDAAVRERNYVIESLFIPIRCDGSPADSRVELVVATEDSDRIQLFRRLRQLENNAQALQRFVAANEAGIGLQQPPISGMIRTSKDYGILIGKIDHLSRDFMVIEADTSPSLLRGFAWLAAGIIVPLVLWPRRRH